MALHAEELEASEVASEVVVVEEHLEDEADPLGVVEVAEASAAVVEAVVSQEADVVAVASVDVEGEATKQNISRSIAIEMGRTRGRRFLAARHMSWPHDSLPIP